MQGFWLFLKARILYKCFTVIKLPKQKDRIYMKNIKKLLLRTGVVLFISGFTWTNAFAQETPGLAEEESVASFSEANRAIVSIYPGRWHQIINSQQVKQCHYYLKNHGPNRVLVTYLSTAFYMESGSWDNDYRVDPRTTVRFTNEESSGVVRMEIVYLHCS